MDRWLLCEKKRIPGLDAVRFLAISLVFSRHLFDLPLEAFNLPNYITRFFGFGWCGVHLFFMLSGYLIGGKVCNDITANKFSFKQFYFSRTMRIFPAYYAFLFVYHNFRWNHQSVYSALYVANFVPKEMVMGHIWSLCCEEQYYILFPALMVLLSRFGRFKVILSVIAVVSLASKFTYLMTHSEAAWASQQLWFNADFFLVGTLLALNGVLSFPGMGLVILLLFLAGGKFATSAVCMHPTWLSSDMAIAHGILIFWCTLVISWARSATGLVARILACSPIRWMSVLSYSFYLYHHPILLGIKDWHWTHNMPGLIAISFGWSLFASLFSFSAIERPYLLLRNSMNKQRFQS